VRFLLLPVMHMLNADSAPGGDRVVILSSASAPQFVVPREQLPDGARTIEISSVSNANDQKNLKAAIDTCEAANASAVAFEYNTAFARFEEAITLFARALPSLFSMDTVARCSLDFGAHALDADKVAKAKEAMRRVLILSPNLKLDAHRYNPKMQQVFNKERESIERAPHSSLTVQGEPLGADVIFDGKQVGALPLSLSEVLAGEHWVVVSSPGHRPFSTRLQLKGGSAERLDVFLEAPTSLADEAASILFSRNEPSIQALQALERYAASESATRVVLAHGSAAGVVSRLYDVREGLAPRIVSQTFSALPHANPSSLSTIASIRPELPITSGQRPIHPAFAILPFGAGQFLEHRYRVGAVLLSSQVLLLATNIVGYLLAQSFRVSGTQYRSPEVVRALAYTVNISFGLLLADLIAGGIDGFVHRQAR
jgi:PEGA domain